MEWNVTVIRSEEIYTNIDYLKYRGDKYFTLQLQQMSDKYAK